MSVREEFLGRFRWVEGHADIWRTFADAALLARMTHALAEPFRGAGVTEVAGVESRGFILGAGVALALEAGFVPIRKAAGLLPGEKLTQTTAPDYRGNETLLRVQADALRPGGRVLLVDDWAETGSQALAAQALVERAGAVLVGVAVLVDQLDPGVRARLPRLAALVRAEELGPSDGPGIA